MSELNREQIIKALECCTSESGCRDCPHFGSLYGCSRLVIRDAIALINELTEENERWRAEAENQSVLWRQNFESIYESGKETFKADTVRKMQTAIKEYYSKPCYRPTQKHPDKYTLIEHLFYIVDQIAKEMLEGEG